MATGDLYHSRLRGTLQKLLGVGKGTLDFTALTAARTLAVPDLAGTVGVLVGGVLTGAVTGNAGTATALATPRAINAVNFDGSAAITVTASATTLTGGTLNATVLASSLTSVGILTAGSTGLGFTIALSVATVTGTLAAARLPAMTGDVTAAAGTHATTLASVGTAGTYTSVTTDAKGRVTAGTTAVLQDGLSKLVNSEATNSSAFTGVAGAWTAAVTTLVATLPTVSAGNVGVVVGIRVIGSGAVCTVTPDATHTIDGLSTYPLWAGESVEFRFDGNNTWFRQGAFRKAMRARLFGAANQAVTGSTYTRVTLGGTAVDPTGAMTGLTASSVTIKRDGTYKVSYKATIHGAAGAGTVSGATILTAFVQKNQATVGVTYAGAVDLVNVTIPSGGAGGVSNSFEVDLVAGDYLSLGVFANGPNCELDSGTSAYTFLHVTEVL